jgi:putative transposase
MTMKYYSLNININMQISKSYKVELDPTQKQKSLFNKTFGCCRFIFNWGLAERISYYEKEKKILGYVKQAALLTQKKSELHWLYDVSNVSLQQTLRNLDKAFLNFFKGLKKGKVGFPKFKCKGKSKDSYRLQKDRFSLDERSITLSKIGKVKLKESNYIPLNVLYKNVTISKEADKYFASVSCVIEIPDVPQAQSVLGIDRGLKELLICSDGTRIENPKIIKKYEKALSRAQRKLSKKKLGSKNRDKQKLKVQKIYRNIKNVRLDNLHKITTSLVKTKPRFIVLEDLNIQGMVKNHCLSKSISDVSWYEIERQLTYKTSWYGGEVLKVDRFFPSSKLCSSCGVIKETLELSDRTYECECGLEIDRDLNAAINLEHYGLSTLGQRGIKACGESVRLHELSASSSLEIQKKQEPTLDVGKGISL